MTVTLTETTFSPDVINLEELVVCGRTDTAETVWVRVALKEYVDIELSFMYGCQPVLDKVTDQHIFSKGI